MKFRSRATGDFWRAFYAMPLDVQERARRAYQQFDADPSHPGLALKRVNAKLPVHSAHVDRTYRALCRMDGDTVTWFWIGHHDECERLLGG